MKFKSKVVILLVVMGIYVAISSLLTMQKLDGNGKFHTVNKFVNLENDARVKRILKRESHLQKYSTPNITGNKQIPNRSQGSISNICIPVFTLDKDDVKKAREQIDSDRSEEGHGYLFYIHLYYPFISNLTNKLNERYEFENAFLQWQFILEKEKFIAQLPVDFDLITLGLLQLDKEERNLPKISLNLNDSNCEITDDNKQLTIDAMHTLLWKEMLANLTKYILCNRQFKTSYSIKLTYYLTTIWIGYGMNCTRNPSTSEMSSNLEKQSYLLFASYISFYLSLQFVWIFAIFEIVKKKSVNWNILHGKKNTEIGGERNDGASYRRNKAPSTTIEIMEESSEETTPKTIEEESSEETTPKTIEEESSEETTPKTIAKQLPDPKGSPDEREEELSFNYKEGDRPYGLQRFALKIFFFKLPEVDVNCYCCERFCHFVSHYTYNSHSFRLMFIIWTLILLPFGLYRTICRKSITTTLYEDYRHVVSTSEPIFYFLPSDNLAYILDVVYATLGPFIGMSMCCALYNYYMSSNSPQSLSDSFISHIVVMKQNCIKLGRSFCVFLCCRYDCSKCRCSNCCDRDKCCCCTCCERGKCCYSACCDRGKCCGITCCDRGKCCGITCDNGKCCGITCDDGKCCDRGKCCRSTCCDSGKCCGSNCCDNDQCCCSTCYEVCNGIIYKINCNSCCSGCCISCCRKCCERPDYERRWCACKIKTKSNCKRYKKHMTLSPCSCVKQFFLSLICISWHCILCIVPIIDLITFAPYKLFESCNKCESFCNKCGSCCDKCGSWCESCCNNCGPCYNNCNSCCESCCNNCKSFCVKVCKLILLIIVELVGFSICFFFLRPMITTFTFVFRSLTYILFILMPIRVHFFRYLVIVMTPFLYFGGYYSEIVTMFSEILSYIFVIQRKNDNNDGHTESEPSNSETQSECDEELVTYIICSLMFVKKRICYFLFQCIVVIIYIFIVIETLILSGTADSGAHLKDLLEIVLFLVGQYVISLFLKTDGNYLTEENKIAIEHLYKDFINDSNRGNDLVNTDYPVNEDDSVNGDDLVNRQDTSKNTEKQRLLSNRQTSGYESTSSNQGLQFV